MRCLDLLFVVLFPSQPFYPWLMLLQSLLNDMDGGPWCNLEMRRSEGRGQSCPVKKERPICHTAVFHSSGHAECRPLTSARARLCRTQWRSAHTKACCLCACVLFHSSTKPSFFPSVAFARFSNSIVQLCVCLVPARSRHLPAWCCWSMLSSLLNSCISVLSYSSVCGAA